jgi:hypothetical protein
MNITNRVTARIARDIRPSPVQAAVTAKDAVKIIERVFADNGFAGMKCKTDTYWTDGQAEINCQGKWGKDSVAVSFHLANSTGKGGAKDVTFDLIECPTLYVDDYSSAYGNTKSVSLSALDLGKEIDATKKIEAKVQASIDSYRNFLVAMQGVCSDIGKLVAQHKLSGDKTDRLEDRDPQPPMWKGSRAGR